MVRWLIGRIQQITFQFGRFSKMRTLIISAPKFRWLPRNHNNMRYASINIVCAPIIWKHTEFPFSQQWKCGEKKKTKIAAHNEGIIWFHCEGPLFSIRSSPIKQPKIFIEITYIRLCFRQTPPRLIEHIDSRLNLSLT